MIDSEWTWFTVFCRVYLKGDKAGTTEIFVDNLPGLPDNLRPSSRPGGGYWVAFAVIRHPDMWSMWDLTANHPWIKRIMASVSYTLAAFLFNICHQFKFTENFRPVKNVYHVMTITSATKPN